MKKLITTLSVCCLFGATVQGQLTTKWSALYTGPGGVAVPKLGRGIVLSPDGTCFALVRSKANNKSSFCVVKYNAAGALLSEVTNGVGSQDEPMAITLSTNSSVWVAGYAHNDTAKETAIVRSYSNSLSLASQYSIVQTYSERYYCLAPDGSGGVYAGGLTSPNSATVLGVVTHFSQSGTVLWRREIGASNARSEVRSLAIAVDGSVFGVGYTQPLPSNRDALVAKLSPAGDLLWLRTFDGGHGPDQFLGCANVGNGPVAVGQTMNGSGNSDGCAIKYGSDGTALWVAQYSGPEEAPDGFNSVSYQPGLGFALGGWTGSADSGEDFLAVKLSEAGSQVWARTASSAGNACDHAERVFLDTAGNLFELGTGDGGSAGLDFMAVRWASDGLECSRNLWDSGNADDDLGSAAWDGVNRFFMTGLAGTENGTVSMDDSQVVPDTAVLVKGLLVSGPITNVRLRDGVSAVVRGRPSVIVECSGVLPLSQVASLSLRLTGHTNIREIVQIAEMYDVVLGQFVQVGSSSMTTTDVTRTFSLSSPNRFVDQSTGRLRLRVTWYPFATRRFPSGWQLSSNEIGWTYAR
ncbi:MAG: hypothetical protein HZC36_16940 [Armatimonadetes bacterium]|nr:hypothetical protein [Armatimonadota bacterium]